ncbi:MAG: polymer-forming cytoskeletal protein [Candidatus Bipolaricaulis sp.]|nr:polymer-forming cytoskeletal protein [Candidatus Bipolaricaulis sp.]
MSDERRSISMSGAGKLSGGDYARVSISGAGKVDGDLKAEEIRISGAGKVSGKTEATTISISGSGVFDGPVTADEMAVSGAGRIEGDAKVKEMKCSGSFRVSGSLSSEYVKVSGHIRVGGNLEADIFKASGGFDVEGLLSADKVEIHLGGKCSAREIGGESIHVERGGLREKSILLDGLVRMFWRGAAAELTTTSIEGDEIELEGTTADVVRGKRVVIGPGCHIKTVEYTETLDVHDDAEVDKQTKV